MVQYQTKRLPGKNISEMASFCVYTRVACVLVQLLLCGKAVAAGLSGSLSVITSVIDSAVDIMSGILLWWSSRAVRKRNPYCYPQGNAAAQSLVLTECGIRTCIM